MTNDSLAVLLMTNRLVDVDADALTAREIWGLYDKIPQIGQVLEVSADELVSDYAIELKLKDYEPGRPNMKPDVLKQIIEIEKSRKIEEEKMMEQQQQNMPKIMININGEQKILTMEQSVGLLQQQHSHINHLVQLLQGKDMEISVLTNELTNIKSALALFDAPAPVLSEPVLSEPVLSEPVLSEPVLSSAIASSAPAIASSSSV